MHVFSDRVVAVASFSSQPLSRHTRALGFTLVELMVSMALGMVVMAAMYSAYQTAFLSNATSRRLAQVTEDAAVAMSVLRSHIGSATYSRAIGMTGTGASATLTRAAASTANWIKGCDGTFTTLSASIDTLACNTTGSDAIAVAFEADGGNSIMSGSDPLDCLGNSITTATAGNATYRFAYHRFYISNNSLFCLGPGNTSGQALVDNIQDMQITYGVSDGNATNPRVVAYQTATAVNTAGTWARVMSVRVCLVVRSGEPVLDAITSYQGCDPFGTATTPTDRRIYRAFTSTFLIKNRAGVTL